MYGKNRKAHQYIGMNGLKSLLYLHGLCVVSVLAPGAWAQEQSETAQASSKIAMSEGIIAQKPTGAGAKTLAKAKTAGQHQSTHEKVAPAAGSKTSVLHETTLPTQLERPAQANAQQAPTEPTPSATKPTSDSGKSDAEAPTDSQLKGKVSSGEEAKTGSAKKKKTDYADVLPCLTWVDPDKEPKAAVLCVHGLGLHNDSYEKFGTALSKLGYLVYAVDMPGFGSFKQAEGRDRVDFDYCLRGLKDTLHFVHKVNPGLPVFILGESMGGAIALRVTAEHPELVNGLISCVPSGDRFNQGKESLRVGLKLLTAPDKEFNIGSSVIERATKDKDLRRTWAEDPLNRMNLTPRELLRFQSFMNDNHESARKISSAPVLFVQGCKDNLVHPEGTMELFDAVASKDKQIELIHDKEHLIFEEGQFDDQVMQIVDKWLASHIESSKQLSSK